MNESLNRLQDFNKSLANILPDFQNWESITPIDGPGNLIVVWWSTGSVYVSCISGEDGTVLWTNPA